MSNDNVYHYTVILLTSCVDGTIGERNVLDDEKVSWNSEETAKQGQEFLVMLKKCHYSNQISSVSSDYIIQHTKI